MPFFHPDLKTQLYWRRIMDQKQMPLSKKLTTAKLHIARLILWSGMKPDKEGNYEHAQRIYQDASDFLADDTTEIAVDD